MLAGGLKPANVGGAIAAAAPVRGRRLAAASSGARASRTRSSCARSSPPSPRADRHRGGARRMTHRDPLRPLRRAATCPRRSSRRSTSSRRPTRRRARDAAFQAELARLLADYAGRPTPLYHAARLSERCGATDPAQARGPLPHRRPQDQQRARPGAARQAHGQAPRHRRDRRRPARRGHGHRLRPARPRVRRVHGRRGRAPPGAQRGAHAPAGRHGRPGGERLAHAQGRHERGAARLGHQRARHLLPASARSPARRRTRPWCATSRP